MSVALILNIETSATVCSVCIALDGKVIAFKESLETNSHARLLTVLIKDLLDENQIAFTELDAVAVSAGPGSYTGLRIGVSVAKGLCYSLDKPLISVPTLFSLAEGIKMVIRGADAFYMPVMDARRMDVYMAIYDSEGKEIFKTTCATLNEELEKDVSSRGKIFIGGNAMNKCKEVFTSGSIHFVEGVDCDSRWMTTISHTKYNKSEFENTAYYEPFYLKEFLPKTAKQ